MLPEHLSLQTFELAALHRVCFRVLYGSGGHGEANSCLYSSWTLLHHRRVSLRRLFTQKKNIFYLCAFFCSFGVCALVKKVDFGYLVEVLHGWEGARGSPCASHGGVPRDDDARGP